MFKGHEKNKLSEVISSSKQISSLLPIIRCPEGVYLKQLIPENGEKINDVWPHKHNGSLYFIQRLIEMNLNLGVFTKDDNELIAW